METASRCPSNAISFIDNSDLVNLFKILNYGVLDETEITKPYIDIFALDYWTAGPRQDIYNFIKKDNDKYNKRENRRKKEEIERFDRYLTERQDAELNGLELPKPLKTSYQEEEPTKLMYANAVYYIRTEGSALLRMLTRPEIDSSRIVTNNIHELLVVFGIGVVRAVVMTMLATALGDNYIDPSYVMVIADVMTNRGRIDGIDSLGIKQYQINTMSLITAESPVIRLINWTTFSKAEGLEGISAQIMTGQETKTGSTFVEFGNPDRELVRKFAKLNTTFNKEAIDAEIQALDVIYNSTPKAFLARPSEAKKSTVTFAMDISNEKTDDLYGTPEGVISPVLLGMASDALTIPLLPPKILSPEPIIKIDTSPPRPPKDDAEIPTIRKGDRSLPKIIEEMLRKYL